MDRLCITGQQKLSGEIKVSKAKNAYLPIIAAVLLNKNKVTLKNIPKLRDISTIFKLLTNLGVKITQKNNLTILNAENITSFEAVYELVKTMRASILVLGPLLTRFKQAKVSLPGGCAIGARPIDLHLKNLEKMGAKISLGNGYVEAVTSGLVGANLVLDFPSVGATENLLMAATLAEGKTIIENAAKEPEIDDLVDFLVAMGAKIKGRGTSILIIEGTKELMPVEYEAIGDRIEAATYIMAGLITNSEIKVTGVTPSHLDSVLSILVDMGANLKIEGQSVSVFPSNLKAVKVETSPFPGFPTDVQAQLMALMTKAKGTSIITENIFENRFMHVPELRRLGAKIELRGNVAIIEGKNNLYSAPVMCTDLRASAALVIAALSAKGKTEIQRVYHLDRGYDHLDKKLSNIGADIQRENH